MLHILSAALGSDCIFELGETLDSQRSGMARRLLIEIELGKQTFQVISKKAAALIGVYHAEEMNETEAEDVNRCLDDLEKRGMITILSRSAAGFVHVDRLTSQGRALLKTLRAG
jgi:hypothetical protein